MRRRSRCSTSIEHREAPAAPRPVCVLQAPDPETEGDELTDLADFKRVADAGQTFCVIATTRDNGTVQASVVNAGVMRHPAGADDVVVCVARGGSCKLANLRVRPAATIVASSGGA